MPETDQPSDDPAPSAEAGADSSGAPPRPRRGRRVASVVAAVVAVLLLPLAVLTAWTRTQLLDTDSYVETVTPLAADPVLQQAVAGRLTTAVNEAADFDNLARQALPDRAQVLAGFVAGGAENLVRSLAERVVASDVFRRAWVTANRTAHAAAVRVLTGEGSDVVARDRGRIAVQLGPLVDAVLARLDERTGLQLRSRVPTDRIRAEYVLVDSPQLAKAQTALRWANRLTWFLIVASLVALVAAVVVAEDRRLGLRRAGISLALGAGLLLVAYAVGRVVYLDNLPAGVNPTAAAATFDILTRYLHRGMRALFVLAVVVLLAVWLVGPSRAATTVRGWWAALLGRAGGAGLDLGPLPAWFRTHAGVLRLAVVGTSIGALLLWERPTGRVVALMGAWTLVSVGAIQLLAAVGRDVALPSPEGGPADEAATG